MKKKSKDQKPWFKIPLSYEQKPKEKIALIGFLFNCKGLLLQQQLVENNTLVFSTLERRDSYENQVLPNLDQLRVLIAPATDKRILKVTNAQELESYKAYEPILTSLERGIVEIEPIPDILSRHWLYCKCRVTGKISKWFNSGYVWENKAVCRARVHICEVDHIHYWIDRIPDHIIAKIPEFILRPERLKPIPRPFPDPPSFERIDQSIKVQPPIVNMFDTKSVGEKRQQMVSQLPELGSEIKQQLASGNLSLIRKAIVNNYTIFHSWFCHWPPFWPYFYRCKELAVVKTDANGRFDTSVTYACFGDKPDIYIWVEYFINGEWTTVYRPPLPCNVHWNYICGTNINIIITDPRVPGDCCCNCPIGGELVFVRTISHHTSVRHIQQTDLLQPPPDQTVSYNRIGLTDASAIGDPGVLPAVVGDYKRPFGGKPSFYVGFGSDLPNNGIYHYRWSYRQLRNAELSAVGDSFKPLTPINGEVRKGYDFEYLDSNNDVQIGADSVQLGPFSVGGNDNLYIIPPQLPSEAPFNVAAASSPQWHQQTYNMSTISFDSSELLGGDGLYEFKLELFDKAGNLLTNIARDTFKVPKFDNAALSENAPNILLDDPTGNVITDGTADAYKMVMRFDNESCEADVFTLNVNDNPASLDCCGFVNYKPDGIEADLEITFEATHPNNFAVFSFGVVKGTCGPVPIANASGMVIDSASGYTLDTVTGVYSKHFTPSELLSECYESGIGKAAFGQNLYVYTMATDGQSRVKHDASKNAAFALEP